MRILVVDDEPLLGHALARTLEKMGHDVLVAGDCRDSRCARISSHFRA